MFSTPRTLGRAFSLALALAAAGGLTACGGLPKPGIPFIGKNEKDAKDKAKLKGERIPVLSLNKKLEPSTALKGVGFSITPAQPLDAWTMAGGNSAHVVEHVKAGDKLQIAWRRRIGDGDSTQGHLTASPVVAEGIVYTMDAHARVSATEVATGKPVWSVNLAPKGKTARSPPATASSRLSTPRRAPSAGGPRRAPPSTAPPM